MSSLSLKSGRAHFHVPTAIPARSPAIAHTDPYTPSSALLLQHSLCNPQASSLAHLSVSTFYLHGQPPSHPTLTPCVCVGTHVLYLSSTLHCSMISHQLHLSGSSHLLLRYAYRYPQASLRPTLPRPAELDEALLCSHKLTETGLKKSSHLSPVIPGSSPSVAKQTLFTQNQIFQVQLAVPSSKPCTLS